LKLFGLPMDDEGVDADAFARACAQHAPKALYLNPTLLNPTTHTISERRRIAIAEVARRFGVPIVEDDPYGFLPTMAPPPFAAIAPELTWHVAGLAKCLGAGLRIAYVVAPDVRSGWLFASAVRTATVMASPITVALATRWIVDGTGEALLAAVRRESVERQRLADAILRKVLPASCIRTDPVGFHLWVSLPEPWTRSAFVGHMRSTGIGVVATLLRPKESRPRRRAFASAALLTALRCAVRLNSWLMRWKPRQPGRPRSFERIATSISSTRATQRPVPPVGRLLQSAKLTQAPVMRANASSWSCRHDKA
jgi:DNA-binding transcriptional MocR family regulator